MGFLQLISILIVGIITIVHSLEIVDSRKYLETNSIHDFDSVSNELPAETILKQKSNQLDNSKESNEITNYQDKLILTNKINTDDKDKPYAWTDGNCTGCYHGYCWSYCYNGVGIKPWCYTSSDKQFSANYNKCTNDSDCIKTKCTYCGWRCSDW